VRNLLRFRPYLDHATTLDSAPLPSATPSPLPAFGATHLATPLPLTDRNLRTCWTQSLVRSPVIARVSPRLFWPPVPPGLCYSDRDLADTSHQLHGHDGVTPMFASLHPPRIHRRLKAWPPASSILGVDVVPLRFNQPSPIPVLVGIPCEIFVRGPDLSSFRLHLPHSLFVSLLASPSA